MARARSPGHAPQAYHTANRQSQFTPPLRSSRRPARTRRRRARGRPRRRSAFAHHLGGDRDQDLVDVLERVEPAAQRVVVLDRDLAHPRERLLDVRPHPRRRVELGVEVVEVGLRDRRRRRSPAGEKLRPVGSTTRQSRHRSAPASLPAPAEPAAHDLAEVRARRSRSRAGASPAGRPGRCAGSDRAAAACRCRTRARRRARGARTRPPGRRIRVHVPGPDRPSGHSLPRSLDRDYDDRELTLP